VLDAMRDTRKLPEARDYPSWKAERREWFTAGLFGQEEDWELPTGASCACLPSRCRTAAAGVFEDAPGRSC
jgi:hypothetical protein